MHPIPLHDILGVLGAILAFISFPIWASFIFAVIAHTFNCLKKYSKGKITVYGAAILYLLFWILRMFDMGLYKA